MKIIKKVDFLSADGVALDEIIAGLPLRSDDECYTVWSWLEAKFQQENGTPVIPEIASRPDFPHDVPMILSLMKWPADTPEIIKEGMAMACEHARRQAAKGQPLTRPPDERE